MGKKVKRFEELKTLPNVLQPDLKKILNDSFSLKGKWNNEYFKNNNPIVLEIGCGKGEYTVELGKIYSDKNFIGIDIKGYRLYVGAKEALNNKLQNVAFIRTRIEFIDNIFGENEISEIWLTFPDPQQKPRWTKKRLVSANFLNKYCKILTENAIIHLKTDSDFLYYYTLELLRENSVKILEHTDNFQHLYSKENDEKNIKTFYEQLFIKLGRTIKYIKWTVNHKELNELDDEKIKELISLYPRSIIPKRQLF